GIGIDMEFVSAALKVIEGAAEPLITEFREITGGIAPTQTAKVLEWLRSQWPGINDLQKGTIDALLGETEEAYDIERIIVPANVRRALKIRRTLAAASVKKLNSMQACVNEDGRARGLLQYHAASTGRWGGRKIQPQNFPRGDDYLRKTASPEHIVDTIGEGDPEYVEILLG